MFFLKFFSRSTPLFLFSFLSLSLIFLIRFCSLSSRHRLFHSCLHFTFTLTRRQLLFLSPFFFYFFFSLHTSSSFASLLFLLFDYPLAFVYFSLRLSNSLISLLNPKQMELRTKSDSPLPLLSFPSIIAMFDIITLLSTLSLRQ